jgi:hypothetical protein
MEPWMKYTGISMGAAFITWFRIPRRERRGILRAALSAMLVFVAVFGAIAGVILVFAWIRSG